MCIVVRGKSQERGLITLIGATTENPSFSCNAALLSRCRVVTFEQLTQDELLTILNRALDTANPKVENDSTTTAADTLQQEIDALTYIANIADGDARNGLNMLEVSLTSQSVRKEDATDTPVQLEGVTKTKQARITVETVQAAIQKTHFLYDRAGEGHYNTISALHKSLRGSDANAGIYWLTRMLAAGEDPLYVARRLIKFASEDVGIADPQALPQAIAAYDASAKIGMPECGVCLAQCVVYLAAAPKSVSVYRAYSMALQLNKTAPAYPVPFHLRNAPTKLMKDIGYKKGYLYNPDHTEEECAGQTYLPDELLGTQFYIPDEPPDPERTVSEQQEKIRDHIH
ncbi:ATPase [Sphaeroforma arctica JP610]|uniref:ATPase n=1 Tax=Sphaeroforma arctica JP610 TaxID=667725 RepID=A0A0L0G173_9EUKA|nr:ATPase [Sphaeroforma arctica JP610]KNC82559.1 ATPase [Sphaeroforma arctica JP610]|eukprot:XP_014156461.1 ATPase [Sphaeroforma arctica JP610]